MMISIKTNLESISSRCALNYGGIVFRAFLLSLGIISLLTSTAAEAMPSFSRQTGQACSSCHTQSFGPNLTPMGRDFKLGGYTMGGGTGTNAKLPPISGMIMGSFTNTLKDQEDAGFAPGFNKNNNFTFDQASLFYAGRVYGKVGALVQGTYDGYADRLGMDNADIRFADNFELADLPITYGVSLNNNPTVQDLWNTTPAWGFPYTGSAVQPGAISGPVIDGALGSQVGGASAYTMINNLLYLEAGAYGSFSNNFQRGFGIGAPDRLSLDGPAPYWRATLQHNWKGHYAALGHYGMTADIIPQRDRTFGADHYTDVAVDATYQYLANPKHIFEIKSTYIYEDQRLSATRQAANDPTTGKTYLTSFKINTAYTFDQTYGITFAYNKINGSHSPVFDEVGAIVDQTRPNSQFYTAELVYVPFGKSNSTLSPWLNLRTSLQYIGYSQVNGTHNLASHNNTFMINGWLAF